MHRQVRGSFYFLRSHRQVLWIHGKKHFVRNWKRTAKKNILTRRNWNMKWQYQRILIVSVCFETVRAGFTRRPFIFIYISITVIWRFPTWIQKNTLSAIKINLSSYQRLVNKNYARGLILQEFHLKSNRAPTCLATYLSSLPFCLYRCLPFVLNFAAANLKLHFWRQTGWNPGCCVTHRNVSLGPMSWSTRSVCVDSRHPSSSLQQ